MFKNFVMKQMLKRQMQGIPQAQQEKIFAMIEKNPDFFTKIAEEIKSKVGNGMSQHEAMMSTMQKHQDELKRMMTN